jgi:uncharacterized protein
MVNKKAGDSQGSWARVTRRANVWKSRINRVVLVAATPVVNLTSATNCLYFGLLSPRQIAMKIPVDEIPQSPREISFLENIEELNKVYRRNEHPDFGFPSRLPVELTYSRSGREIFLNGSFCGQLTGYCGRCLEKYRFTLEQSFALVLTPEPVRSERGAEELHSGELGLSYYSTDEIDLEPLIAEQVILALPTRPLCSEECRGLCVKCGANLNRESCNCATVAGDPRMAIFRSLKVGR